MTKIISKNIEEAAKIIIDGGLVVFPTETVYGIGADALNSDAIEKVYKAKGRPSDNPLIVHVSNIDMLKSIVLDIGPIEQSLIDSFWPGPLTIIFKKKDVIPSIVSGGLDSIGVRLPDNSIALELIEKSSPLVGPSANVSGKPSGTTINDIIDELNGNVDIIIDDKDTQLGIESTVVKIEDDTAIILRPGIITPEDIESIGIKCKLADHIFDKMDIDITESPGTKYKHYAPTSDAILIYSDDEHKMAKKIDDLLQENSDKKVVLLSTNYYMIDSDNLIDYLFLGKDNYEIAHNMFSFLRKADSQNPDLIIIEGVKKEGIGIAIMNRLIRACNYNYIEIN